VSQENGAVTVPKYAAVHDAGRINNPMLGEGQVQGGIAQGLGQAHLEGMVYSEDWQLSTMGWAVRLTRLGVPHEFYSYPEADHAFWTRTEIGTKKKPLMLPGPGPWSSSPPISRELQ